MKSDPFFRGGQIIHTSGCTTAGVSPRTASVGSIQRLNGNVQGSRQRRALDMLHVICQNIPERTKLHVIYTLQ